MSYDLKNSQGSQFTFSGRNNDKLKNILRIGSLSLSGLFPILVFGASLQISGQVWLGNSGAPARGATVRVNCGSQFTDSTTVDSSGVYRITGLPTNTDCHLSVTYDKKDSLPLKIPVSRSDVQLNLELSPWKKDKWLLHKR